MSGGDRIVVVTGAASGIGRRLVDDLLAQGDRVLAADIDGGALDAIDGWPAERVVRRALDVRDPEAWGETLAAASAAFGGVDVVMNVAGVLRPGAIASSSAEDVDFHLDVNLKGVIHGTRAAARLMVEQGRGHIINIASLASMAPVPGLGLYVASKYGVRGFSMAAAQELRPRGVFVSCVCPDAVRTPMLDLQVDYPEAAITFTAPRFLTPEDVSALVLGQVMRRRPVIASLPRSRAFLARLSDLFPAVATRLVAVLDKKGRKVQEKERRAAAAGGPGSSSR
ncbi:MAG: SDR family oxidoreductase [Acidobacteriota bacterium]